MMTMLMTTTMKQSNMMVIVYQKSGPKPKVFEVAAAAESVN